MTLAFLLYKKCKCPWHWLFYLFWLTWAAWCSLNPTNLCHIDEGSKGKYSHCQCHFLFGDKCCASNSDIGFTCFDWHGQHNTMFNQHICVTLTRVAKGRGATVNVTFISRIKVLQATLTLALLAFANLGSMMLFKPKNMCHIDQVSEGKYSHWQCHFLFGDKGCASNSDIGFTCFG